MNELERCKIMNVVNPFKKEIVYWYRYVDDIICLYRGDESKCKDFLIYLNSISNKIKFTIETNTNEISFLDLKISKEENKHKFKIHRKPTQTDLIIPKNSNHPWQHKMSSFYSLINRLLNVPMNENDYKDEKRIIKTCKSKDMMTDCGKSCITKKLTKSQN